MGLKTLDVFLDVGGVLSDEAWVSQMFLIVISLVLQCGGTFTQAKCMAAAVFLDTLCVSCGVDPCVDGNGVTPEDMGAPVPNPLFQS